MKLLFPRGLLAASLALSAPGALDAQSGRAWRADERVLVSAFHQLGAVTADIRHVYAASPWGMEVYDVGSGRWLAPVTVEDGYPAGERPTALAADRIGDAVWLGTASGALYEYSRAFGRWEPYGLVAAAPIERIVPGSSLASDAVYLRTRGGWLRLRRGSRLTEPATPGEVARDAGVDPRELAGPAQAGDPVFQSLRGTLTLDEHLRRWPITDVAAGERPSRLWVATDGGNLFLYDGAQMRAEPLPFGLLSQGSGALARDGGVVWFGGDGRGPRRGVARAGLDLQGWRQFDAPYDGAPAGYVHAVLPTPRDVWFAASDGLFRYDRASEGWSRLTEADRLPSTDVRALAAADGVGIWVGTRRGLAFVGDATAAAPRALHGWAVNDLAVHRDTLWVASDGGLWVLPESSAAAAGADSVALQPAPGTDRWPQLRGRVVDVLPEDDQLLAITEDALFRFDGAAWHGPFREASLGGLGRLHTLAAAGGQLWIAGQGGVARWDRAAQPDAPFWTFHLGGLDLPPGPIRDVLPLDDHVWVSTPSGAMRLEWRP